MGVVSFRMRSQELQRRYRRYKVVQEREIMLQVIDKISFSGS